MIAIDIAVPADVRIEEKEKEKKEKYKDLKREIRRLWKLRNVEIVPVVIRALGSVSVEFNRWAGKLGIICNVEVMQKTAKNTEESIGNLKTRVFCQLLVICYDSPNRRNDGNSNSQNISVKNK